MTMSVTMSACGVFGGNEEDDSSEEEPAALAAPSGLEATSGDSQMELSWEAVSEAGSYNVYRSTSSTSGAEGDPLEEGVSQASYTDTTAENGTTYYYRVTAVGSEGKESDPSSEVEATPFTPPSDLEGDSGNSQVNLGWSSAVGAESYNIYRTTSPTDGAEGDPFESKVSEANYTDTTAENGTTYYYRVVSVNPGNEESSASEEVKVTPFDEPPSRP